MRIYDLAIAVEKLDGGGDYAYIATSPDLPGLIVAGDTPEEVLEQAPHVAAALIASIITFGDPLPHSRHSKPKSEI
jgi:predicted RNase H-like HicB family nuclease